MARFTSRNVSDIQCTLIEHAPDDRAREIIREAIGTIYSPGDGVWYADIMGDPVHALKGAQGARACIALLYAVGARTGAWDNVSEAAFNGDKEAKRVKEIMYDLNSRIPSGSPACAYFDTGSEWTLYRLSR